MFGFSGIDTKLQLQAGASRAAQLSLGQNATNDVLLLNPASTTIAQFQLNGRTNSLWLFANPIGAAGDAISVGAQDNQAVGTFVVGTSNVAMKGVVAKGRASQTGNLLEVQDSSSNPLSGFTENGYFFTRKTAVVADAELAAGELALWFDSTNGAAKLMVKAKETGGTVRTASVALA